MQRPPIRAARNKGDEGVKPAAACRTTRRVGERGLTRTRCDPAPILCAHRGPVVLRKTTVHFIGFLLEFHSKIAVRLQSSTADGRNLQDSIMNRDCPDQVWWAAFLSAHVFGESRSVRVIYLLRCLLCPPLRPAAAASSEVNRCARPLSCAALPPLEPARRASSEEKRCARPRACAARPPAAPALRASSVENWCALPEAWAARPPFAAISCCRRASIAAKPCFEKAPSVRGVSCRSSIHPPAYRPNESCSCAARQCAANEYF